MPASKKKPRTPPKRRTAKPTRKVAETKTRYATGRTTVQATDQHLEFHITLPNQADVEKFIDSLITLVESAGGSVGGGMVPPED